MPNYSGFPYLLTAVRRIHALTPEPVAQCRATPVIVCCSIQRYDDLCSYFCRTVGMNNCKPLNS
uniref:Uncharacterized protein n=1 Tax=Romanomermis culicivorax TaxID=13658 RepID=A0A915K8E9_ROMCU